MSYEATIKTATGTFGDNGDSGLLIEQFKAKVVGGTGSVAEADVLNEAFRSLLTTTFPIISTAGHVTGGGQIPTDITFGIGGKSDDKGMKAQCTVVDRSTDTTVKCIDVTTFVQTGNHVTFSGHAMVNGVVTQYTIDVDDIAEPGRDADVFTIVTTNGYSATGVLTQGNIQVHGQ